MKKLIIIFLILLSHLSFLQDTLEVKKISAAGRNYINCIYTPNNKSIAAVIYRKENDRFVVCDLMIMPPNPNNIQLGFWWNEYNDYDCEYQVVILKDK